MATPLSDDVSATVTDSARLAAVRATGLLDAPAEPAFDRLTRLAVRLLKVPAAFFSLVDDTRDFYVSACGFGEPLATARELTGPTFCHYAIQARKPLVIPDTAADPLYREVPTVRTLGVAAYMGVPLAIDGQVIGSFCAIDNVPRPWTESEVEVLVELAASAEREIGLRAAVHTANALAATLQEQAVELEMQQTELEAQHAELEAQRNALRDANAELARAATVADDANRAKSQFLASMSHELRTPLNAILGYRQLLEAGIGGPVTQQQEDFLRRMARAQDHLLTLINDVLQFAKLEAGEARLVTGDIDVASVAARLEDLAGPQLTAKGIRYTHAVGAAHAQAPGSASAGNPLCVRADADRVLQILLNLLTNAIKFTPRDGSVTLRAERAGGNLRLHMSDTGVGIAPAQLDAIFDPFVQIGDHRSTREGVGLGLAISRELARKMDGDVTVASEVGVGSTFTLVLPISGVP